MEPLFLLKDSSSQKVDSALDGTEDCEHVCGVLGFNNSWA